MGYDPEELTIDETRRVVGRELNIPGNLGQLLDDRLETLGVCVDAPGVAVR